MLNKMLSLNLLAFSAGWLVVIYFANCLVAHGFLPIQPAKLTIYIFTMAALGLFGEIAFDTIYRAAFGEPLWLYHLCPIHDGFTSMYSLYLWGTVGAHLYFLHGILAKHSITSVHTLAAIFWAEAILLEALVNLSYLAFFKDYIYYYLPSDLWHITSLQALPFYLLAGYITVVALKYANRTPKLALTGNSLVLIAITAMR